MEEEEQQQQQAEYYDYTHYLTAVSYLRANSYALAIQQQLDESSSNNRRRNNNKKKKKKKLKLTDPFYIDLCPPIDTLLGYRIMSNNNGGGGGGEMLLKALNLKKLMSEKKKKQKNTEGGADPLIIYDLTAGLARDTLVILSSLLQQ